MATVKLQLPIVTVLKIVYNLTRDLACSHLRLNDTKVTLAGKLTVTERPGQ
jgi:hypothetical protein